MKRINYLWLMLLTIFILGIGFVGCETGEAKGSSRGSSNGDEAHKISNNLDFQESLNSEFLTINTNEDLYKLGQEILKNRDVSDIKINYDSGNIDIVYKNGMLGGLVKPFDMKNIKGSHNNTKIPKTAHNIQTRALNNIQLQNTNVLSLALQYWDWGNNDDIPKITKILEEDGNFKIKKDYQSKVNGNLELFYNLSDYGIILLSSHGDSYDINDGKKIVIINTNTEVTRSNFIRYIDDILSGRVVIQSLFYDKSSTRECSKYNRENCVTKHIYSITPQFIEKYNKNFENTIIYMSICRGTYNNSMANAFIKNGASVYLGYSDYVGVSFARTQGVNLFTKLLSKDYDNTYNNIDQSFTSGIIENSEYSAEFKRYSNSNLIAIKADTREEHIVEEDDDLSAWLNSLFDDDEEEVDENEDYINQSEYYGDQQAIVVTPTQPTMNYGAIAFSQETDAIGISSGAYSPDQAEEMAMGDCMSVGCEIVTTGVSGECLAIATDSGGIGGAGWAVDMTLDQAEELALYYCNREVENHGCKNELSFCID